jgi:hypothetical protein
MACSGRSSPSPSVTRQPLTAAASAGQSITTSAIFSSCHGSPRLSVSRLPAIVRTNHQPPWPRPIRSAWAFHFRCRWHVEPNGDGEGLHWANLVGWADTIAPQPGRARSLRCPARAAADAPAHAQQIGVDAWWPCPGAGVPPALRSPARVGVADGFTSFASATRSGRFAGGRPRAFSNTVNAYGW